MQTNRFGDENHNHSQSSVKNDPSPEAGVDFWRIERFEMQAFEGRSEESLHADQSGTKRAKDIT
jgi:hypothetical protein